MAKTKKEKLAEALLEAHNADVDNIVHSKNLSKTNRTLLIQEGYLKQIIKGWYLLDADLLTQKAGESALWYESVWAFIGQYIENKLGSDYWLSPELSLDILTESNTLPKQIIAYAPESSPRKIDLPNGINLLIMGSKKTPYSRIKLNDLVWGHSLESSLMETTQRIFTSNPLCMQIALERSDVNEVQKALMHTKNASSGARLVGAYKALGMRTESRTLQNVMNSAGFDNVASKNPFEEAPIVLGGNRNQAPSAKRVRAMWASMRDAVVEVLAPKGAERNFFEVGVEDTLSMMEEIYVNDAYHSLSIEGYKVTPELIEKVSNGNWSPDTIAADREQKDALAARGYYDAFNKVKSLLEETYQDGEAPDLEYFVGVGINEWYNALFTPCVTAGIIDEADLAGYRKGPVYIKTSMHVPPASEQLMDCIDALKGLIAKEENYAVKAVLGHLFVGYIHPFPDGNGRTARFLMNYLLVLGGYSWTVIRHETRSAYLAALEDASVNGNITPFAKFVLDAMEA